MRVRKITEEWIPNVSEESKKDIVDAINWAIWLPEERKKINRKTIEQTVFDDMNRVTVNNILTDLRAGIPPYVINMYIIGNKYNYELREKLLDALYWL